MIDFLAIILGLFFVLLDVSALPMFAKGFIIFDFSLFYINFLTSLFKDRAFLYLIVITIFKSFFLLDVEIIPLFLLYSLSILTLFILERFLNLENIILTLLISIIFLFFEVRLISSNGSFYQIISTLLIHLVIWVSLINILKGLFNLLNFGIKGQNNR